MLNIDKLDEFVVKINNKTEFDIVQKIAFKLGYNWMTESGFVEYYPEIRYLHFFIGIMLINTTELSGQAYSIEDFLTLSEYIMDFDENNTDPIPTNNRKIMDTLLPDGYIYDETGTMIKSQDDQGRTYSSYWGTYM